MEFTSFTHTQYRRQDNESTHFSSVCSALGLRRFGWGWRLCCLTWFLHARLDGGRSLFVGDLGHSAGGNLVDLMWSGLENIRFPQQTRPFRNKTGQYRRQPQAITISRLSVTPRASGQSRYSLRGSRRKLSMSIPGQLLSNVSMVRTGADSGDS